MKKNKQRRAFQLLSLLNKAEKKDLLSRWSGTPAAKNVLEILLSYPDHMIEEIVSSENFSYGSFRVQQTEIVKAVEKHLAHAELSKTSFQNHLLLMRMLNSLLAADPHLCLIYAERINKIFTKQPKRGATYYRAMYELTVENQTLYIKDAAQRISWEEELNHYHQLWYWHEWLHLEIMNLNRKISKNQSKEETTYSSSMLANIRESEESNKDMLFVLLKVYDLLRGEGDFTLELIRLLEQNETLDERNIILDCYMIVLNHLIRQSWKDTSKSTNEALAKIIPQGMKNGLYLIDNQIQLSVLVAGIKSNSILGRVEEAQDYLNEFQSSLSESDKKKGLDFLKGMLAYYKGDYYVVITYDPIYSKSKLNSHMWLNYQLLIAQSHYHLGNMDALEKKLRNISQWLEKATLKYKYIFESRLNFFAKLISIKGKNERREFITELNASTLPFNHRTFFEKMSGPEAPWL